MVREATEGDANAIAVVEVRAWQGAYQRALGPEFLNELSVPLRAAAWESTIPAGFATTTVAEHEGAIIGVCSVSAGGPVAEVLAVYVDPLQWQRGVGRALLEDGFDRIGERPWEAVHAWVFLHNAMGRAFLARFGFRMDKTRRTHELSGAEEVRMAMLRKARQ
jgi:N-acetylglutamate synthase-like GNAT family acetyltransferase